MKPQLRHLGSPHPAIKQCHGAEKEGGIAQALDTATFGATDVQVTHPQQRWQRAFLDGPSHTVHGAWANCRFSTASNFAMTSVLWRTGRGEACVPILQTVIVCASLPHRGLEQAGFTPEYAMCGLFAAG